MILYFLLDPLDIDTKQITIVGSNLMAGTKQEVLNTFYKHKFIAP